LEEKMILEKIIFWAGIILMVIAMVSLLAAIFAGDASVRKERRSIFLQGFICALVLWYISWLIG